MAINPMYTPYNASQYYIPQQPMLTANYPNLVFPTQFAQTPIQPSVTQSQIQNQFTNIWFDGTENDARLYPIAPNNAVAMWSTKDPIIYLKKADSAGKPEFIIYDITERKNIDDNKDDAPKFASQEDMSSLVGMVKSLSETIGKMQNEISQNFNSFNEDIEKMKSDMYGIAGKKRISKKVELEEDV